ncbi:MAG: ankyrin repeat domain-containing protein [Rickettsiaceae bacterium]|jgi:ankyrin repeat protein|nr:ankyrin repeat domain-containing protein [Rickettsiaceae bacterium]
MKSIVFDKQHELFFAVLKGDYTTIQGLVSGGQSINTCRHIDGFTPLFIAVSHNNLAMLKFLLSKGADATLKSKSNNTALDLALSSLDFSPELVENLLSYDKYAGIKFEYYKLARTKKYDAHMVSIVRKILDASYIPGTSDYSQIYGVHKAKEPVALNEADNYIDWDFPPTEVIGAIS